MKTSPQPSSRIDRRGTSRPHRPAWRQRLVQAERGIASGVRNDSTFFVHFFAASVIVAIGVVVGLGAIQWAIVTLAFTMVMAAEMFHQVLRFVLLDRDADSLPEPLRKALGVSTAAVTVTIAGALLTIGLLLGGRLTAIMRLAGF